MTKNLWILIGFIGECCFFLRFLVQWIVSERKKSSTIPVAFWYLSLIGGLILLSYALYRRDPVFIAGQSVGLFVYCRNLSLIRKLAKDDISKIENELMEP